ncbi:mediator of RNA polymerase II transcription subunit 33A [Tanacetum coccineum]
MKLPSTGYTALVPFVVDDALTACALGRPSPRELCTGIKDVANFLPASFSDYYWPSPAANLANVEDHISNILAATNVNVPRLYAGSFFVP